MKQQKKFYVIYQITNLVNGKIYIGKHKTNNLDDDYMGSGKNLHRAYKKYGRENFVKTILFYLQNEDEMNLLEKMVVTKEFCDRDDTYNLNVGGDGGWSYVESCGAVKGGKNAMKKLSERGLTPFTKFLLSLSDDERKQFFKDHPPHESFKCDWTGRHHSEETKAKISASRYDGHGENNSMFGKMWICNDLTRESKVILKSDPIPKGWRKGRIYKK